MNEEVILSVTHLACIPYQLMAPFVPVEKGRKIPGVLYDTYSMIEVLNEVESVSIETQYLY